MLVCDTDFLIKISNDPLPKLDLRHFLEDESATVIPNVLRELKGLASQKSGKTGRRARSTLRVIREMPSRFDLVKESTATKETDLALVDFAKAHTNEAVIATLDGSLISRLEKMRIPYLTLRHNAPFFRSFDT